MKSTKIDAKGIHYKILNEIIHREIEKGYRKIIINNVYGQRYIGDGLKEKNVKIIINGTPGNDLAAFMDGPEIVVNGNAQDGTGNTMNAGKIIVYGDAGDITGHSMRGGKIFVKGNVGYRVGIHMKAYKNSYPVIVIGGKSGDFLGEYMAGGLIIVLGIEGNDNIVGDYTGTGMHGGAIFIRGKIREYQIGKEIKIFEVDNEEISKITPYLKEFSNYFKISLEKILSEKFYKLIPATHRPYGKLYAY